MNLPDWFTTGSSPAYLETPREASVEAEADVSAAEAEIDRLSRDETVTVTADTEEAADKIGQIGEALDETADAGGEAAQNITGDFKSAGSAMEHAMSDSADRISQTLKHLAAAMAAAFSVKKLIDFGKESVEAAAEINAANSQLAQTFGSLQSNAEQAMQRVANTSGIVSTRLQGVGTSVYAFAKTSGMDSVSALAMMEDALTVTADSAAYYDRSLEETGETLKSFLKGNYANDAALGISCTETTRNTAANKLYGKSFRELSEAQKQLTLLQMVKDANALSGAEGQAAREADGWENVLGNLKEAWKQLLAVVGQPILTAAVAVIKEMTAALQTLTQHARTAVNAISDLLGIERTDSADVTESIAESAAAQEALTDAVEETTAAQENQLAGFDKITKLTEAQEAPAAASAAAPAQAVPVTIDTAPAEQAIGGFGKKIRDALSEISGYLDGITGGSFSGMWDSISEEAGELAKTLGSCFDDIRSLGEPLKRYYEKNLTPALRTCFDTIGRSASGMLDTLDRVFGDIWNLAAFPMLTNFINVGLPLITDFYTQWMETAGVAFDTAKGLFDMLWTDAAEPALTGIAALWNDMWALLGEFWGEFGQPIFDGIQDAVTATGQIFSDLWNLWIKPVFDLACEACSEVWTQHLQPLLANILGFIGELITGAISVYNNVIAPIVHWLIDLLAPYVKNTLSTLLSAAKTVISGIIDRVSGLVLMLRGVIVFLKGIFTGNWKKAWQGIKQIFKGIWDALVSIVKTPINLIIDLINGLTGAVESALNWIIEKMNTLSWKVPDWVLGIGGKTFGFDFDPISIPKIPHLASGMVVPANYGEFLAVLGDNRRETEVVTPLSTIEQAVRNALAGMDFRGSGSEDINLTINLDGKQIYKSVVKRNKQNFRMTGRNALAVT
ncbi:MAG: hypothetical protein IJ060_09310 [Oscillospiraceae bacterium]|nr:hypothetical protein [Oscillospiraceae bacterium]